MLATGLGLIVLPILLAAVAGCASRSAPESPAEIGPRLEAGSEPPGDTEAAANELFQFYPFFVPDPTEELAPGEELTEAPHDQLATVEPELTPEEAERERSLVTQQPPTFDIPIEVNDRVLAWIDHYANRQPDKFEPGLVRSGRYLPMFREIFAENGLPQDLVYMAHVESAYKTTAYSRARAKGIFQFISSTGRRYGLRVDYWVDERSDPEKSARAAAAYLNDLYEEFGDWYLALAAYNGGEGKVRRALARSGRKDFWGIARTRYLRRETKNYVPAVLAATLISKEPGKYGFEFEPDAPLEYETVPVEGPADLRVLAKCAGTEPSTLKVLNPALRRFQTPPGATTDLRVPPGTGVAMLAALQEIPRNERVLYARHYVRRGETLSTIARAYGVTVYGLQQANRMGRRTLIREGQTLLIPTSAAAAYPGGSRVYAEAVDASGVIRYRVRRGDTLSEIARHYGTTPSAIAAASGIGVHSTLRIGQRLTVVPGTRSAAAARRAVAAPATAPPPPAEGSGVVIYHVRRGDTLSGLARRYRTSPAAIAAVSGIYVHSTLQIGQRLTIVPAVRSATDARLVASSPASDTAGEVVHTVRRGDTLWRIATMYRTSVASLCALNRISRETTLYPGERLTVRTK